MFSNQLQKNGLKTIENTRKGVKTCFPSFIRKQLYGLTSFCHSTAVLFKGYILF